MGFLDITILDFEDFIGRAFSKYFMQFLEISWDFGILGFSKILGYFQKMFGTFDEVYEDFQTPRFYVESFVSVRLQPRTQAR